MTDFVVRETAGERIMVLPRPLMLPGCCAICGYTGTNVDSPGDIRVFIDFNLDVEFYGRVYWCSGCLLGAANNLGWLGVEQTEELRSKVQAQESELIVLREQNERLRASLASLLGSDNNSFDFVSTIRPENEREGSSDAQGTDELPQGEQSVSDQSSSEQGPVSIPTDSSNDDSGTEPFEL